MVAEDPAASLGERPTGGPPSTFDPPSIRDPHADEHTLAFVDLMLHAYDNPNAQTEQRIASLAPLFDTLMDQDDEWRAGSRLHATCSTKHRLGRPGVMTADSD